MLTKEQVEQLKKAYLQIEEVLKELDTDDDVDEIEALEAALEHLDSPLPGDKWVTPPSS